MTALVKLTTVLSIVGLLAIFAGVIHRRLWRACRTFPVYLACVMIGELLVLIAPSRFYAWSFWLFRETVYAVLKLIIALELAALSYQAFPGAAATARRALLAVLVLTSALLFAGTPQATDVPTLARDLQPRLAEGTLLVFLAVWALAFWYHLPLHRWHKAILRGFVPYLLVFSIGRGLLMSMGWRPWAWVNAADIAAYLAVLAYWSWEAWRIAPAEGAFLAELQPWRARL